MLAPIERKERSTGWWLVIGLLIFCPSISYAADLRAELITAIVCFGAWYPLGAAPGATVDAADYAGERPRNRFGTSGSPSVSMRRFAQLKKDDALTTSITARSSSPA